MKIVYEYSHLGGRQILQNVGVEIVPCHSLQKQMSTGVSYGEQLVYDIERLKRHFPAVPVYLILVDI